MKTTKLLLIILLTIGFVSCKKTHCYPFPIKLKEYYYPYLKGELLKFTNNSNDTLTVEVVDDWATDNNNSLPSNCKCECDISAGFDTEIDSNYSLKFMGRISIGVRDGGYCFLNCYFYDDSLVGQDRFEISKDNVKKNFARNPIFGDTIYFEKRIYHRINNVKIVKNKGIVEFWDKQRNCNWVKIE